VTHLDLESLVAIDTHAHVEQDSRGCFALDQELLDASAKYYRSRKMAAVIFTINATTGLGHPPISSEEIADVAADFPGMTIILAHPSVPWQGEAISIATHRPNVYIDLSGWSPKHFPPQLVRAANGLLSRKVLFGSDYPVLTPDRWLADFENWISSPRFGRAS